MDMVKVKVTLLGDLANIAKVKNTEVELSDGSTLKDLFNYLISKYGSQLKEFLDFSSKNRAFVMINSKVAITDDVKLNSEDNVVISPPMEGG